MKPLMFSTVGGDVQPNLWLTCGFAGLLQVAGGPAAVVEGARKLAESGGVPYLLRSPDQLATCFEGLTMVPPGLVQITRWRPDETDIERIDAYGAVARKP